jgi:2-polyprenyl-6-methoxyphenol hydroxylase-like FAD-dependent oxidoreductase
MRGAVLQLERWGVLADIVDSGTPPVTHTSFHYGDEVVEVPIKARGGVSALYAPRRTVLDRALADAAMHAGARIRYGARVVSLERASSGRVTGVEWHEPQGGTQRASADLVIGADGLRSTIASLVGSEVYRRGRHATAVLYAYWQGLSPRGYEWRYRPGVSTGVIPTNGPATCVFASMPAARFRGDIAMDVSRGYLQVVEECSAELSAALRHAERIGSLHGFPGEPGYFRRSWGPGWALVGDAGYFKDPLTAHGITDALRDAELLARAVARGSESALRAYEDARDDLATVAFEATDAIASFNWTMTELRALHRTMVDEMAREVRALDELDARPLAAPARERLAC